MVCLYNGILFSHEKEWNSDSCCNMDEPWEHYADWTKSDTKGHILWFHLYEMFRKDKSIETESRLVATIV